MSDTKLEPPGNSNSSFHAGAKSNLCDKLSTSLCGSFVLLFSVFMKFFPCFYLNNNCSILFFIKFSAKDSLLFMMNSISCLKFSSASLGRWNLKQNVLESLITIIFSSMIIMTRLNCCKLFRWFYYDDTKDIVFVLFHFLICMNCFQLSFELIILEV